MKNKTDDQEILDTKYALQVQKTEFQLESLNDKYLEQVELFKEHVEEDKHQNSTHIELLRKVSDQVDFSQKCLDNLNTKLELSHQTLRSEIEKINLLDEQQNKILDEHIAGVNTLKDLLATQREEVKLLNTALELRINSLEQPVIWLSTTKKVLITTGAIAGSITVILKLLEVI